MWRHSASSSLRNAILRSSQQTGNRYATGTLINQQNQLFSGLHRVDGITGAVSTTYASVVTRSFLSTVKASATANPPPFDKILIANRGEIACRVMRTCRQLGVKTVAVYSDADAEALHVQMADEAYRLGSASSGDSYLRMDRVLAAALASGAQAVHPGYGFLSENSKFVDMVEKAGLAFIGPSGRAMELMGDKIQSKRVAKAAGCFIIPGFEGEVRDAEHAVQLARDVVGYPVMIKASAGGGGKGMRVAHNDTEVREGFALSKAEAAASFGDDRMLIERFIEDPHHIEIQVLADTHGNVLCFPERECSVQRRNQKVIEEAPSCLLTPATRLLMQQQAALLCQATGYRSAGTVEMLADSQQNFYFLEMNTRLQVEHPVTELISGQDLVAHMLYVAAGRAVPDSLLQNAIPLDKSNNNSSSNGSSSDGGYRFAPVPFSGWAMESRVYAEDPLRGFLPSIGPLITYREPFQEQLDPALVAATGDNRVLINLDDTDLDDTDTATIAATSTAITAATTPAAAVAAMGEGRAIVRVDSGIVEGNNISMHYDPMISKLCTYAATRAGAIRAMEQALDRYVIKGLGNNITFLRSVCGNSRFRSGDYSTKFIAQEYADGFHGVQLSAAETNELIAVAAVFYCGRPEYAARLQQLQAAQEWDADSDGYDFFSGERMVVLLGGQKGVAYDVELKMGYDVKVTISPLPQSESESDAHSSSSSNSSVVAPAEVRIADLEWQAEQPLAFASFSSFISPEDQQQQEEGTRKAVQYLGRGSDCRSAHSGGEVYLLRFQGSEQEVIVRSPMEHQYSRYMLPPAVKDASKSLLCPMPGTLISCSVTVGQSIEIGQQLAVVEAMKMQNVLRAERAGVVKAVLKAEGANMKVDEVIIEFE